MTPAPVDDITHRPERGRGCIQIWSLAPRSQEERDLAKAQMPEEVLSDYDEGYDADMVCEMVICIEGSEVREMKWLPFSCCDAVCDSFHPLGNVLTALCDRLQILPNRALRRLASSRPFFVPASSLFTRFQIQRS
jgi:hypothetical protein